MITGENGNKDKAAQAWGPFILAYDSQRNSRLPRPQAVGLVAPKGSPPLQIKSAKDLAFEAEIRTAKQPGSVRGVFVPFAEAGRDGGAYRVWLPAPDATLPENPSLLSDGTEIRSRRGNVDGSIIDGDPRSFVVTFNGEKAEEDWFAVTLDEAVRIARVVYTPGKVFHDGGWFDASAGKPRVQVQRQRGGPWETVGEIASYPATTATDSAGLEGGEPRFFSVVLREPLQVWGIRVFGKPACGGNPDQAFSSCGEFTAF
jgi:hypothetical protein